MDIPSDWSGKDPILLDNGMIGICQHWHDRPDTDIPSLMVRYMEEPMTGKKLVRPSKHQVGYGILFLCVERS